MYNKKILTGQLHPGEKLPPENDLAGQFGVGQTIVRTAPANLEADILISGMRGKKPL